MNSPYKNDPWWWCDGYPMGNVHLNQFGKHQWAYRPYTTGWFKKVEHDYWICSDCGRQTDIKPVVPTQAEEK